MTNKKNETHGCITSYTNCIKYDGVDIPCIGIKKGDYINHVICSIIEKLCSDSTDAELSTISLTCLLDKYPNITEPLSRTVGTFLQLLIDNQCNIKDLIELINKKLDSIKKTSLNLDLKCLLTNNPFQNNNYSEEQILQLLINEICSIKLELQTIKGKIVIIESEINAIKQNVYSEPLLSSCIYTNKPVSQAVNVLAGDYCTYKNKIGTINQIDLAISRQCSNINTIFTNNINYIQNPVSQAESINNIWLALCDANNRLTIIENTCCKPGCDKIKIGFVHSYDSDTKELTLTFTSGSGTFIPSGFVDCGSEFTFKGCDKTIILTSIQPIIQGESLVFELPAGVCTSSLEISIKTKFCLKDKNGVVILTCQDCLEKTIKITDECCTLVNPSIDEEVFVTYSYNTTIL